MSSLGVTLILFASFASFQTQTYTVTVNDGLNENSASLTVKITKMNQRLPKFSKDLYTFTATELATMDIAQSVRVNV